jgi:GNAT superfamily N-acetyltransferase
MAKKATAFPYAPGYGFEDSKSMHQHIALHLGDVCDDHVVGGVDVHESFCLGGLYELNELYIDADYRGKGYGRMLIEKAILLLHELDNGPFFIEAYCYADVVGFYKKLGFEDCGLYARTDLHLVRYYDTGAEAQPTLESGESLPDLSEYFINKGREYVFYLTQMEGAQRNRFLKIKKIHYCSKKAATKWMEDTKQILLDHCDVDDEEVKLALDNLIKLYAILVME